METKKEIKLKRKNTQKSWVIGFAVIIIIGLGMWTFVPWTTLFPPTAVPTPADKATSSFTLIDYRTGEDVSAWVEVSVWVPDADDLPFDDNDPYRITNFDEEESSKDAEDVTIDLRDYGVAWLEIDPDFESDYGGYNAVFNALATRDFRKLVGGGNYDYYVYVYHAPSNVSVAMLEQGPQRAGSNIGDLSPYNNTVGGVPADMSLRGTDGNYTVYLDAPVGSTDAYHAGSAGGDEWNIDDDELDDIMTDAAEHTYDIDVDMNWLQDQSNHRTIAPMYDMTDDVNRQFGDHLEQYTNCFAIKFGFNASVSVEDGNRFQVNLTVMNRDSNIIPADVVYDAEYIFIIFYEPITIYDQFYNFDVELEFADHIWLGNVTTVRLVTPDDDNNLGTATAMNEAFMNNYVGCG